MHAVFKALVNGLYERGDGGVLWIRGDEYCYCFPDEFSNAEFAYGIRLLLNKPESADLFFVIEEVTGKAHVVCYERARVIREFEEETKRLEECRLEEDRPEEDRKVDRKIPDQPDLV